MNSQQLQQADWLDILFDQRNKLYGAYLLRRTYEKRLRIALLSMCMVVIAGSFWIIEKKYDIKVSPPIATDITPLAPMPLPSAQAMVPPPPPPPPLPKALPASSVKNVTFRVVQDQLVHPEEMPPDIDKLAHSNIALQNNQGAGKTDLSVNLRGSNSTNVVAEPKDNQPPYFISVERMPEFPGGEKAMFAFLAKHLQFTELAREAGIQGTVYISFVIDKNGSIQNIKVVKGLGYGLDEEAVKAVQAMPPWKPGKQNGKAVPVLFELPVKFALL